MNANEYKLLQICSAQREYVDGKISREEMDSRIEMANQNYQVMVCGEIKSLKHSIEQSEMNRKIRLELSEENKKKGFWRRWKTSKH